MAMAQAYPHEVFQYPEKCTTHVACRAGDRVSRSIIRHALHAYVRGGMGAVTRSSAWLKRTTSERGLA